MASYMNGFLGSPNLQTSVANQEILPTPSIPNAYGITKYSFYKFDFMNDQDCHIIINNTTPIFLRASQGFSSNPPDQAITSFKIQESSITFNWVGEW